MRKREKKSVTFSPSTTISLFRAEAALSAILSGSHTLSLLCVPPPRPENLPARPRGVVIGRSGDRRPGDGRHFPLISIVNKSGRTSAAFSLDQSGFFCVPVRLTAAECPRWQSSGVVEGATDESGQGAGREGRCLRR